jgi:hypothetical protein
VLERQKGEMMCSLALSTQEYFFNGVGSDGQYLSGPTTAEQIAIFVQSELENTSAAEQTRILSVSEAKSQAYFGFDAPVHDVSEVGWGVVVHNSVSTDILREIEKLRLHRKTHSRIPDILCPEIIKVEGIPDYKEFLASRKVTPGVGEVKKLPYYLLLIGGPDLIPYRFQYELATEYAVGRLAFPSVYGYRTYIDQLIEYETARVPLSDRRVVFWGTGHEDDIPTSLSSQFLVSPLYEKLDPEILVDKELFIGGKPGWEANKANLTRILSRRKAPALLFTASHGFSHSRIDSEEKKLVQGALITQEWKRASRITPDMIYSGEDLTRVTNVRGMVHFAFACFGAGTPSHDDYITDYPALQPYTSQYPFVSHLANQELMRGALAFIGHVDRAWGFSFLGAGQVHIKAFERCIRNMLLESRTWPIGHCLRDMYDRALHLSKNLLEDLHDIKLGRVLSPTAIANQWVERNDARAYALIGDPAIRLRFNDIF